MRIDIPVLLAAVLTFADRLFQETRLLVNQGVNENLFLMWINKTDIYANKNETDDRSESVQLT